MKVDASSGIFRLKPSGSRFQSFNLDLPPGARILVPFWNATLGPAASVEIEFEIGGPGGKVEKFSAALWGPRPFRGSFRKAPTPLCRWDADTLTLLRRPASIRLGVRLRGTVRLSLLGVAWRKQETPSYSPHPILPPQGGKESAFPAYSQRLGPPDIAGRICSPSALSMALAGLTGKRVDYGSWAWEAYDRGSDLFGNWSFNTAAAAEFLERRGLTLACYPAFLEGLESCRSYLAQGNPLILSLRFGSGELPGSPLRSSKGHLILLRGFDGKGGALVQDPAANGARGVRRVYGVEALDRAWRKSGRLAYVFAERKAIPSS